MNVLSKAFTFFEGHPEIPQWFLKKYPENRWCVSWTDGIFTNWIDNDVDPDGRIECRVAKKTELSDRLLQTLGYNPEKCVYVVKE
jgi:hypothetical protein